MSKHKENDAVPHEAKEEPKVAGRPICSVCGNYDGEMTGSAGDARWHAACEASHPHVIAKVKARA